MLTLVTGGAGSGKSAYAEQLAVKAGALPRLYVATMRPSGTDDREFTARVARHRAQRADKGFVTIEQPVKLDGVLVPTESMVLVECLSNLAANEWFSSDGAGHNARQAILSGVERLCATAEAVIVVSNELFSDGRTYDADTQAYLRLLGELNQTLAHRADRVVELVYGLPVWHKGGEEST